MLNPDRVDLHFAARLVRGVPAANEFHAHAEEWQVEFLLAGPIKYEVEQAVYRLGMGGLIIIPPGREHRQESAASARSYLLKFVHATAHEWIDGRTVVRLAARERARAEALLADLTAEHDGRSEGREVMIRALLDQFLLWAKRWATRQRAHEESGRSAEAAERVRLVADMLRRRHTERFTIAELAREAHLSRSRFMELFREEFGTSPGEFHRRVQMEKAVELAKHTGMTWEQIARHLGFDDPSYFSRAFKKVMGMSPSNFVARAGLSE